jgi:hypothetical protein
MNLTTHIKGPSLLEEDTTLKLHIIPLSKCSAM